MTKFFASYVKEVENEISRYLSFEVFQQQADEAKKYLSDEENADLSLSELLEPGLESKFFCLQLANGDYDFARRLYTEYFVLDLYEYHALKEAKYYYQQQAQQRAELIAKAKQKRPDLEF